MLLRAPPSHQPNCCRRLVDSGAPTNQPTTLHAQARLEQARGRAARLASPPARSVVGVSGRSRSGEHALTRWRALREAMTRRLARNRRRHNPPPGRESALALVRTPHDPHARPLIHTSNLLHSACGCGGGTHRASTHSSFGLISRRWNPCRSIASNIAPTHTLTRSLGLTLLG